MAGDLAALLAERTRRSEDGQPRDLLCGGTDAYVVGPQSQEINDRPVGLSVMSIKAGFYVYFRATVFRSNTTVQEQRKSEKGTVISLCSLYP